MSTSVRLFTETLPDFQQRAMVVPVALAPISGLLFLDPLLLGVFQQHEAQTFDWLASDAVDQDSSLQAAQNYERIERTPSLKDELAENATAADSKVSMAQKMKRIRHQYLMKNVIEPNLMKKTVINRFRMQEKYGFIPNNLWVPAPRLSNRCTIAAIR